MARSLWKKGLSLVLSLCLVLTALPRLARAANYTDIAESPAKEAIERWSDYGIIHGDTTGAFHPEATVTRAEAAQFVVNLLHLEKTADLSAYADVDEHAWYAVGLSKCVKAGLISGSGNRLMPTELADRQTVMVLLCLTLGIDASLPHADTIVPDDSFIAGWARGYVYALLNMGFDVTKGGQVHPTDPITRAEFVLLLDELIATYINQDGTHAPVAKDGITLTVADRLVLTGLTTYPVVVAGSTEPWVDLSQTRGSYPLVVRANNAIVTGAPARCSLNTVWAPNCTVNGNIYATYTLQFVDQDGLPVPRVKASLWEDSLCHAPKTADNTGRIIFPMTPYNYHSEILSVPDGYLNEGPAETYLSNGGGTYVIRLTNLHASESGSGADKDEAEGSAPNADAAEDLGQIRTDVPEGYGLGDRMPDLTFTDAFGNVRTLYGTLQVKDMVLVTVWNTRSFWSLSEMQILSGAYQKYQDSVEIFALSDGDTQAELKAFARTGDYFFPMGQDPVGLKAAAGLSSDPLSFVVDRYGIITRVQQGSFVLQGDLEHLFEIYTAADYPSSVFTPEELSTSCDTAPSTPARLSAALNVPGGKLLFHSPDTSTAWPFVALREGNRTAAMASNVGVEESRAIVGFQATAQSGDCLVLEYKQNVNQNLEVLVLTVDGTAAEILPSSEDWTTYVYPLPAGAHTITLSLYCGSLPDSGTPSLTFLDNISVVPEDEAVRMRTGLRNEP